MAKIEKLIDFILKWEGGYVDHPNDPGGATNMGVTIGTLQGLKLKYDKNKDGKITKADVKLLTKQDATDIMKSHYWDKCRADEINSQAVANILVDWFWMSGVNATKGIQKLVGFAGKEVDGKIGKNSLKAINETIEKDEKKFVEQLYAARTQFYNTIISKNRKLESFRKGWTNRLNDLIKYNKKFL